MEESHSVVCNSQIGEFPVLRRSFEHMHQSLQVPFETFVFDSSEVVDDFLVVELVFFLFYFPLVVSELCYDFIPFLDFSFEV